MAKQLLVGDGFVFETRLNTLLGLFGACLHPVLSCSLARAPGHALGTD